MLPKQGIQVAPRCVTLFAVCSLSWIFIVSVSERLGSAPAQPDAPVHVQITPINPAICAVTPPAVTPTPEAWQTPAVFSVNAVASQETAVDCEFVVMVESDDPDYHELPVPNLTVTVQTPQVPGLALRAGLHRVGAGDACAADAPATLEVEAGSQVVFCFVVENTGDAVLHQHRLSGNLTGPIFTDMALALEPGASYSHALTRTVTVSETYLFQWRAVADPDLSNGDGLAVAQAGEVVEVTAAAQMTLLVDEPTSLPEDQQPGPPARRIFVPGVIRD